MQSLGVQFTKALIERVGKFKKVKELVIWDISCGDVDEGEELGVRLAEVIAANNTIETLWLCRTGLLIENNAKKWGESLMQNNTLTTLYLHGVVDDITSELKRATKDRTPELYMRIY